MKNCIPCGAVAAPEAATCARCGEGTWGAVTVVDSGGTIDAAIAPPVSEVDDLPQSEAPAAPCCAGVGSRYAGDATGLEALGAALLAAKAGASGAESMNAISQRTGIRKAALVAHRDHCLIARMPTSE